MKYFLKFLICFLFIFNGILVSNASTNPQESNNEGEPLKVEGKPFTGDFDQMQKRRIIRFLIPYSKTFFFLDGATPRGLTYERIISFEKSINQKLKNKHIQVHAIIIPTARENLIPYLEQGIGDVATGNLTITEDRLKQADFTNPFLTNVNELLVTHKLAPNYTNFFDLAGQKVYVRKSSSYYTSLQKINRILRDFNKDEIKIAEIDDNLEDEDILEMINANILENTIVDQHKAVFWAQILPDIKIHYPVKVASGGEIGWAIRKDSPLLKEQLNQFVKYNRQGTLAGNILLKKYLKNTKYITNSLKGVNRIRYDELVPTFEKYGAQYNFDHYMLIALAYQESRLNQNARSEKGAVGVMQILPSTAQGKNVNIPNIEQVEANIHAGTKYLRYLADKYFPETENIKELDRVLFTFAAYNAGPGRVNRLRKEAAKSGFNPDVWFNNVEIIAAKRIGRETVQYVSNIFKYYIAYSFLASITSDGLQEGIPLPIDFSRQDRYPHPWHLPTMDDLLAQLFAYPQHPPMVLR